GQRIDTEDTRMRAVARAKRLCYTVVDTTEKGRAQVSRGGLVTSQFDPATLQARNIPGFFACGEALDIDGPCGGYNLAWAWKSGLVCGTAIAGRRS
ncbi:MAG: NAD(P)/FAD-dependent oxidoreductase, partial [Atopobiaceae bacterium]|nr:NAD(P)/FAD-dependent oxidoreductase [Atopobiaceae bacterium]